MIFSLFNKYAIWSATRKLNKHIAALKHHRETLIYAANALERHAEVTSPLDENSRRYALGEAKINRTLIAHIDTIVAHYSITLTAEQIRQHMAEAKFAQEVAAADTLRIVDQIKERPLNLDIELLREISNDLIERLNAAQERRVGLAAD